ncbi:hypothetical protein JYU23_00585 [bacterium AH-315-C07]|nr:hypothetical protein [bacterium AH-315-C07]
MNIFEEEVVSFIELLCSNKVKFILVGGVAVNFHGYSRTTGDIDIWIQDSKENRKALVQALTEFKIKGAEIFLTHPLIAGYSEILLGNGIYLDMMAEMKTFKQKEFNDCYKMAINMTLNENCIVKVLHINSLIKEKEASDRPKDMEDVEQLKRILSQHN